MSGWVKIHRKIIKSNMYKSLNSKQRDVLLACLLSANFESNDWEFKGQLYTCKPGQFITSLDSLSELCASDVKVQSVRTALLKLEKWQFLTNESTKTGRLITICNWGTYQDESKETNKETNKELTKLQQRANKELTTIKKEKKEKKEKNDKEYREINLSSRKEKFKERVFEVASEDIRFKHEITELNKFIDYWVEHNEKGFKMRFEMQKTFNIKRRLDTWFQNKNKWHEENRRFSGKQQSESTTSKTDSAKERFFERVAKRASQGY